MGERTRDQIGFDPLIFPVESPGIITLSILLPRLDDPAGVEINARDRGVILKDGEEVGKGLMIQGTVGGIIQGLRL